MGTDITMCLETKSPDSDRWTSCDTWRIGHWVDAHTGKRTGELGYEPENPIYDDRNAQLFDILGGMGCDFREQFNVVAPSRDVPDDASPEVLCCMKHVEDVSWLTLEELQQFDWEQLHHETGTTYRAFAGSFCSEVLPKLASYGAPDAVRIVFGFT